MTLNEDEELAMLAEEENRVLFPPAFDEPDEDAYEPDDPKHPTFHDRYADVWDMREGK